MIDKETVDRIYAAANIVEIVGDYVTLKRKGTNYQACCPFHNEKTPSFVVSPAKGVYKCFGCSKGGNAVTFVMEMDQLNYPDALKVVAKRYGIEVKEKEQTLEDIKRNDNRESLFALNSWAYEYFIKYMHHDSEGISVGMSYFRQKRAMTDAIITKFGLGFCPSKGDRMSRDAKGVGYKDEFLVGTGLSLKRESDGSLYDRFRDRVIFPIHNISGRVVGFGGRTLRTDKNVAKYQNSPESEVYSKKRELYGLFFAKRSIQQLDNAIMVEGYMDVISMHQAGVENVVASSGTSLTIDQIRLLNRFTKNITVIYDSDPAGLHASIRGIDMILAEGMNVRIVQLPEGDDPDSFAGKNSAAQVQDYIRSHEEDFLSFKARILLQGTNNDPIKKAEVIGEIVVSIAQIAEPIRRSVYIKECARIMDIDENILISEVARKRVAATGNRETDDFIRRQTVLKREESRETKVVNYNEQSVGGSSMETLERELIKYLVKSGHCSFDFKEGATMVSCNVAEVIFAELDADSLTFGNVIFNKIMEAYREQWMELGVGIEVPMHFFINHIDPDVCNMSVDLLTSDDNYVMSEIWKKKEIHSDSDEELLVVGVPKAVMLYKSKEIGRMIKELWDKLNDENITDDQVSDVMLRLSNLNKAKVSIAKKLHRLIL